jgi:class 3 adenylate cyclase/tetratricopeptide (TPR) repeat protein
MPKLIDSLRSYVPWLVARHFMVSGEPLREPIADHFEATILFADISGFSKLASHLSSEQSLAGPERLTTMLNRYFGTLIDIIWEHGGDVVKFAGDGIYAVWPKPAHPDKSLQTITYYAVQAALRTQQQLHEYEIEPGHFLSLRIGLSSGHISAATVGGVLKRWEFLLSGTPLAQVNEASEIAERGEVVADASVIALVEQHLTAAPTTANGYWRVDTLNTSVTSQPIPPPDLPETAVDGLSGFVAGAITSRLSANQVGWLAENRRVSVMFVNIHGITQHEANMIDKMQSIMRAMQMTLYRHEGSVRQFIVDDKGTIFIAAFGVPPLTHEDDPIRSVHAAVALKQQLNELGYMASIGIATGTAFCGPVGNSLRREYAMVGDVVVLAARLMGQADDDQILTDSATATAARTHIKFREAPARRLKGYQDPVPIFIPQERTLVEKSLRPIIGREAELNRITDSLDRLEQQVGHALLIEGAAGIGKTRLVEELKTYAVARQMRTLSGKGDFVDRTTPYHAWRDVLSTMFEVNNFAKTRSRSLTIMAKLAVDPELSQLAPLLNTVLPLDIQETETTEAMSSETRAENTRYLLLKLLEIDIRKRSAVIILEDAHWMDSASWALVLAAVQRISNLLLVVIMRPLEALPSELIQLRAMTTTTDIHPTPLTLQETGELIAQRLEVVAVNAAITTGVYEKAHGNPLFTEQLVYALSDEDYITTDDGECHLREGITDMSSVVVPDTLQEVITARVDRLPPPLQLTLKVASVIGENFLQQTLVDIYPIAEDRHAVPDYLQDLITLDLIVRTTDAPEYAFKQSITRDVAYNIMLFAQRKALHEAVARWYERNYVYDLSPFYALLAYHWQQSEVTSKQIEYLEKAAQKAYRNGAYREVVDFLTQAEKSSPRTVETRKVRWASMLFEAYWAIGNLQGSRTAAERVLDAAGQTLPQSRTMLIGDIVRQVGRQIGHRLLPGVFIGRAERSDENLRIVRAYNRLQEVFYFANSPILAFYAGFRTLNLAESIGDSLPELPGIYANSAIGMSIVRLPRLARIYEKLAIEGSTKLADPAVTARVSNRIGVYLSGYGKWQQARMHFSHAIQQYTTLEDKRGLGDSLTASAFAEALHGDFTTSHAQFTQLESVAMNSNNREHTAWAMSGLGSLQQVYGDYEQALELMISARKLLEDVEDRVSYINNLGTLAAVHLEMQNYQEAYQSAVRVFEIVAQRGTPISYVAFGGYANMPYVFMMLSLCNAVDVTSDYIRVGLQKMRAFVRVFPVGRPRYMLLQGMYALLNGKQTSAARFWKRAVRVANEMDMPYEAALANWHLSHYLADDATTTDTAQQTFANLNAAPPTLKGRK